MCTGAEQLNVAKVNTVVGEKEALRKSTVGNGDEGERGVGRAHTAHGTRQHKLS